MGRLAQTEGLTDIQQEILSTVRDFVDKKIIPVAEKVRLIEALADAGLKHIACVSYVNPKRVPTMADAEEVASKIRQKPGIEYAALWLNQQGLERALAVVLGHPPD